MPREDFKSLWIVTRLFEFNDWKDVKIVLEDHFHSIITINPLSANKAIIESPLCNLEDKVEFLGKWQGYGLFHILFEKWNGSKHSRPVVVKGYGGWISIKTYHWIIGALTFLKPLEDTLEFLKASL